MFDVLAHFGLRVRAGQRRVVAPGIANIVHQFRDLIMVVELPVKGGLRCALPLLEFGKKKISNCAALISQAKPDAGIKQSDIKPR